MKFRYHNILWVFLSITILIFIFSSIDVDEERLNAITQKTEEAKDKNGLIKSYASDGKLKTEINYVNGVKHGKSFLYYRDGKTVQLEMPYSNGKRHGLSKKYFESGELYAETSYENDVLHGTRKIYYKNGRQKALVPYGYGNPGTGLVEYLLNGKKKSNPDITYYQEQNRLFVSTTNPCRDQEFYVGKLVDGQYFNKADRELKRLPVEGDDHYVDLEVFTPSYLQYQDIICSCKSSQGNPMILVAEINASSLKKVN